MTQEDKDLLLKDICARLPHGVKIAMPGLWDREITVEPLNEIFKGDDGLYRANASGMLIEYIKPYLFPLSSMSEEQEIEYDATFATIIYEDGRKDSAMTDKSFDWLNANHFDYRGLIQKGLAIDATNLNIY